MPDEVKLAALCDDLVRRIVPRLKTSLGLGIFSVFIGVNEGGGPRIFFSGWSPHISGQKGAVLGPFIRV